MNDKNKIKQEKKEESKEIIKEYIEEFNKNLYELSIKENFFKEEKDLEIVEDFCIEVEDINKQEEEKEKKKRIINMIGIIMYQMRKSLYEWAHLRTYFIIERIKKVMKIFIHFIIKYMEENIKNKEINKEDIQKITIIFKIGMEEKIEKEYEDIIKIFSVKEFYNEMSSEGIIKLKEKRNKEEIKEDNKNILDKQIMKGLLNIDVTKTINKELEEKDIYGKIIEENQRIFNYEEKGIGKYFEYITIPIDSISERIKNNKEKNINNQNDIQKINKEIKEILIFIMNTFPKIEPTCIGYISKVLVKITEIHDLLSEINYHDECENLVSIIYSIINIIGENIGNIVVETNMQAYCAAHLFQTLLPNNFSLKEFLKSLNNTNESIDMPCLYPMAVALTFSREVFQKISNNKKFIVDESSYKNVSSIPLKLKMYDVEFDALTLQNNSVLSTIILSPGGKFLDIIFSLLLMSFLGIGYLEQELLREKKIFIKKEEEIKEKENKINKQKKIIGKLDISITNKENNKSNAFLKTPRNKTPRNTLTPRKSILTPRKEENKEIKEIKDKKIKIEEIKKKEENNKEINYDITRSLPLYLSIFIFGESSNEELRKYVSKYFNAYHLDVIIFLTQIESNNININSQEKIYGPLVKDKESIMNLRSLCSSLVNYNWLSEQLMGYIIRKQNKEYPIQVPNELIIFLTRVWINRITNKKEGDKEDMQGINLWETMNKNIEKIIKEKEWKKGEVISQEYMIMMLLIYNSFKEENKKKFIIQIFNNIINIEINKEINKIILSRLCMMLKYMIEHFKENGNEIIESIQKNILTKDIIINKSENIIYPNYMKYNQEVLKEIKKKIEGTEYQNIEFYSLNQENKYQDMINKIRRGLLENNEKNGEIIQNILSKEEYCIFINKLLQFLQINKIITNEIEEMINEYLYHNIIELLTILPPSNNIIEKFQNKQIFSDNGINDGLIILIMWMNLFSYDINPIPKEIEDNAKELFKDLINILDKIGNIKEERKDQGIHYESIIKIIIDTIKSHCWNDIMIKSRIKEMEEEVEDKENIQINEELLKRKKVIIKIKEEEENTNNNLTQREILKKEINSINEIMYKEEEEEKEKIKEEEIVNNNNKIRIIDNLPILPIQSFSEACNEICIKKPQILFDIITKILQKYSEMMKKGWREYIEEKGINKEYSQIFIDIMYKGIDLNSIEHIIEEMYSTPKEINEKKNIIKEIGTQKGIKMKEFIHPLNYLIESIEYHPNITSKQGKIGMKQSLIESIIILIKEICERNNINGNYQDSKIMKEIFKLSISYINKFIEKEIIEVGKKLCGDTLSEPMMKQAILPIIDDFLEDFLIEYQNKKEEYKIIIPNIREYFKEMKKIIEDIEIQKQHGKVGGEMYYYQHKNYYREPNLIIYFKCASEIIDKEVNEEIMKYIIKLCNVNNSIKDEIETIIEGNGKEIFSKWGIQNIIGFNDNDNIFRIAESSTTIQFFKFINTIMKINAITGQVNVNGVIEAFSQGIEEVFKKYPNYIGKYFKIITEYSLENGEFIIILNSLNNWLEKINKEYKEFNYKEIEGISSLFEEIQHIIMIIPKKEKKNEIKNLIKKEEEEGNDEIIKIEDKCSKKEYKEEFKQPMYHCYVCDINCCNSCIKNCHEGHDTIYLGEITSICECKCKEEEEEKKKDKKRNNDEGIKDKKQQAILRALNRDYTIPKLIKELIKRIEETKEHYKEEKDKNQNILKNKIMLQNEGIGIGYEENILIDNNHFKMKSSQNMRIIPMVSKGIIKQNLICCDEERIYYVRKGNEIEINNIQKLLSLKRNENNEENNIIEVPFEIINMSCCPEENKKILVNGYRNAEIIIIGENEEEQQIELVMDNTDKDIFINCIEWIDKERIAITTRNSIKIFEINKINENNSSIIESSIDYKILQGEILSSVIIKTPIIKRIIISTTESELFYQDIPKSFNENNKEEIIQKEFKINHEKELFIIKYLERENILILSKETLESYLIELNNKGEIYNEVETIFETLPTYFIETSKNTMISNCQENKSIKSYKIMNNGLNYIKLYEKEEIGGICYSNKEKIIFIGICNGNLIGLKETEEIEKINKLKPMRSNKQRFFEKIEYIKPEDYEIKEDNKKIIIPEGKIQLYHCNIQCTKKVIRGIKIYFGKKVPKQINFKERNYPIGEGERWYDIELRKKESLLNNINISYCSTINEEDNISIEDIEIYGESKEEFNYEERKIIEEMKKEDNKEGKENNIFEECIKKGIEIIGIIYNITRSNKDRDEYKEDIINKVKEIYNKGYKGINKACQDTLKLLSVNEQTEQKIIEKFKEINEKMINSNDNKEWNKYLLFIYDNQNKKPNILLKYLISNPRFITNFCNNVIDKYNELKPSIISILIKILLRNIEIIEISKNHYKQHFEIIKTIILLPQQLSEIALITICQYFTEKKPRIKEIEYTIRSIIQENKIIAVEKQIEIKGGEIEFEYVKNIKETLNVMVNNKNKGKEEKLQTITETKEMSINKIIDEREPIEMNEMIYGIINGILEIMNQIKEKSNVFGMMGVIFYWIITQKNYIIKEEYIDNLIDKMIEIIKENNEENSFIIIKLISCLLSSLDIEYYQQYTRNELTNIIYSFKQGILPKPSVSLSRIIAKSIIKNKNGIEHELYQLFNKEYNKIINGKLKIQIKGEKGNIHRKPISENNESMFDDIEIKIIENIMSIIYYLFNYKRDMEIKEIDDKEIWNKQIRELVNKNEFHTISYSCKRVLYQFGGGAYAFHLKTDSEMYQHSIPKIIEIMNQLIKKQEIQNENEFKEEIYKIIRTSFKRPNLFQQYIREDNEIFLLMIELLSMNLHNDIIVLLLKLLRSSFLINVDKTIREKPIKYGITQLQTIIEERQKVLDDLEKNKDSERIFVESICKDSHILHNIILSLLQLNDKLINIELTKLIESIGNLANQYQRNTLLNILWDCYPQFNTNSTLLSMISTISFLKAQGTLKIDHSINQYLN
ncbi:centromeric protein E, putative [Entamoeba dispar SAW760]|uniref:Centromeric protein E, putative n=1 Tax=Entamoeba dispar (strain ATCC PRA-260 / SAW760) TaxID=370354 RepID=B0EV01_ENTDS|nr:centromeric protein E, putative [Entamoeba dispar SAW760]EDR21638.1 centromeric protein E, putative [Entamoeba dispar SAW760]|eukprot:EDR21638.1 centromeric protein E, putative [Entamoeba dispar SAW760]